MFVDNRSEKEMGFSNVEGNEDCTFSQVGDEVQDCSTCAKTNGCKYFENGSCKGPDFPKWRK